MKFLIKGDVRIFFVCKKIDIFLLFIFKNFIFCMLIVICCIVFFLKSLNLFGIGGFLLVGYSNF